MNQDEWAEPTMCGECGAEIWPEVDRAFPCSAETYVCFACAERRGGAYDVREDRWVVPPDVSGLFDERRQQP
jgi:hypothetical protein